MDNLPAGWCWASIADISLRVASVSPESEPSRRFRYIDISSIDNRRFRLGDTKTFKGSEAPSRARRPVAAGDVLFSNVRTYLRNVALVPTPSPADLCSTGFTVIRPGPAVVPEYLFRYVLTNGFIDRVTPQQTGSHYPATSDSIVLAQGIPLAPLAEQQRIVAKLDAVLARVNACRERLEKLPGLLARFRQSVLSAACSGRLTADWRLANPPTPSASALLDSLETDEQELHLQVFEDSSSADLPESWRWAPFGKLGQFMGGGTPSKAEARFWKGSIPWVSAKDMKRDRISDSEDHISKEAIERSSTKRIPAGSILFVVRGMILAHTLPTAITERVLTINQDLKALVPAIPEMGEYLFLASKCLGRDILFVCVR